MAFELRYGAPIRQRYGGAYLFVLSHMRSFSSLFCHVLGSHPEVSGYGETQQSYFGRRDLDRLVETVREQTGDPAPGRYVLDKLLHNRHEIAPAIVARPDVRLMFLLRSPADTITSIVNMAHALAHQGEFSDPMQVAEYYVARVTTMARFGEQHAHAALYVDAQRLVDDTDAVLAGVARWLALATPLSREYRTFPLTGARGHGDPSPNIRAGRVVADADERHRDYIPVTIPRDALARADAAYAACRAVLTRVCARI